MNSSYIAIVLTIVYTIMLVNSKYKFNNEIELFLLTLLISILWSICAYLNKSFHICIGYLIVVSILIFFIIHYHL